MNLPPPPPPLPLAMPAAVGLPLPVPIPTNFPHQAPPPTFVLLVNVPLFLYSSRSLRDWIVSCGNARSVVLVPAAAASDVTAVAANENDNENTNSNINPTRTALLQMSHPDSAVRLVSAFRQFKKENTVDTNFQAHLVPTNPDVPLPPAMMDAATVIVLAEQLKRAYESWKKGGENTSTSTPAATVNNKTSTAVSLPSQQQQSQTIINTTTGEQEDSAHDPLQAPHVLQEVQAFRRRLEEQQGSKATKRKELVSQKLQALLPAMRERIRAEQVAREAVGAQQLPPGINSMLPHCRFRRNHPCAVLCPTFPRGWNNNNNNNRQ
jgi:hypothetical protein